MRADIPLPRSGGPKKGVANIRKNACAVIILTCWCWTCLGLSCMMSIGHGRSPHKGGGECDALGIQLQNSDLAYQSKTFVNLQNDLRSDNNEMDLLQQRQKTLI